jgi:hypothetical protein
MSNKGDGILLKVQTAVFVVVAEHSKTTGGAGAKNAGPLLIISCLFSPLPIKMRMNFSNQESHSRGVKVNP